MGALAGLFGGKKLKPDYTGLMIQTSSNSLPIPIGWGYQKLAPNVLWYDSFQVKKAGSGKGGIFGTSTGYVYYAAVIMGLCEGPILRTLRVWRDQSVYNSVYLGLTTFEGTVPQAVWSYLASAYPGAALAYQGTAYVCSSDYYLGENASVSNHNFELLLPLSGTGFNAYDADPARVVYDFLTNPAYGVGFPADSIDTTTLFENAAKNSCQDYCNALGLCFSPLLVNQETASTILSRWLQIMNTAPVWSGGKLKFVPYGDEPITAGTQIPTSQTRQIQIPGSGIISTPTTSSIQVCTAAQFVSDQGVKYANTGAAFAYVNGTPDRGQYTLNPAGTYEFSIDDQKELVTISFTYQLTADFTPNTTPVYSLADDDFVHSDGEDPLKVAVSDPYKAYNHWTLNILDRDNAYNSNPVFARDQASIEKFGLRMAPALQASEICDANVGAMAAQIILQRSVYIRQTFTWKSSWELCLLEPMDIVEISDANLGLTNFAVRITEVEEDEEGLLTITAEEFPIGTGSAARYPVTSAAPFAANRNATASAVNAPIIFEPTDALAGAAEIWAVVSGSDPTNYGGCAVWYSTDGMSFQQIGDLQGYSFQGETGELTAALPSVAPNPTGGQTIDNTNTLSVSLAESDGSLDGGSVSDMTSLATLAYVDGELVAYQNATLTGANAYNLAPLVRGAFDTPIGSHAIGAKFARLNSSVIKLPYTANQVGQQIYLKFAAYNLYGAGDQNLADVTAYPYTIKGTAYLSPLPSLTEVWTAFASGFEQIWWTEVSDFRPFKYEVRKGDSWAAGQFVQTLAHPPFAAPGPGTYWISPVTTPTSGVTVYSDTPISLAIAGNMITANVLSTDDEQAANWPGAKSSGVSVQGSSPNEYLQLDPTVSTTGTYTPSSLVDLGYVGQHSINITSLGVGVPTGQNFLGIADFLNYQDLLGSSSTVFVDVHVEIALSQDGSTFGSWQRYVPGQYLCRAWKARVVMTSLDGTTSPALLKFAWSSSVPARIDHYLSQSVGTGGLTITFKPDGAASAGAFNGGPDGSLSSLPGYNVSWSQQSGDYLDVTALSETAMTFSIMNGGSAVARTGVNVVVEGF